MSCDTLSKLITETLIGLGMPSKELCEIEDSARAVTHALALLKQHSNFSAQNLDLKVYEWSPADRDVSLQAITDMAIPAWVERKLTTNTNSDDDYWAYVPICDMADLEDARLRGEFRCSFYIDDEANAMRVKFSYNPDNLIYKTHRLWYSPNVTIAEEFNAVLLDTQNTGLLENFFPMVSGMAELELIPTMRIRAAMNKDPNTLLISAWDKREAYLTGKVAVWKDRFNHYVFGERGSRRGRRRRNILPRGITI